MATRSGTRRSVWSSRSHPAQSRYRPGSYAWKSRSGQSPAIVRWTPYQAHVSSPRLRPSRTCSSCVSTHPTAATAAAHARSDRRNGRSPASESAGAAVGRDIDGV